MALQALASNKEESTEARHFGYGHIDIGSWWILINNITYIYVKNLRAPPTRYRFMCSF